MQRLQEILRLFSSTIAVLFLVSLTLSCTDRIRKLVEPEKNEDAVEVTVVESVEIPAVVTYDGLWFREQLDGTGTRQLDVGEIVTITGEKEADPENNDRFYYPVRLGDGSEGWTSEWFTISESVPAVLTKEAKVYSEPKLSKLTDTEALNAMLIVAAGNEGSTDGFVRVSYTNSEGYARIDDYIKADSLSYNESDITAAHLFALAESAESESMKSEFLESASGLRSPAFGIRIDKAREGLIPDRMEDATVATVIVDTEFIEFFAEPSRDSEVIGSAYRNEILGVNGRSDSKSIIEGEEAWWYSLDGGGWIWGGDVLIN